MVGLTFSKQQLIELGQWLKVIGEPNRLLILEKIIAGVHCNCELGDELQMAPNLISHHLGVLRETGLVEVERASNDARWMYYSINLDKMTALNNILGNFFNTDRIMPRRLTCGPQNIIEISSNKASLES